MSNDTVKGLKLVATLIMALIEIAMIGFALMLVIGLFATNASILVAVPMLLLALFLVVFAMVIDRFRPAFPRS